MNLIFHYPASNWNRPFALRLALAEARPTPTARTSVASTWSPNPHLEEYSTLAPVIQKNFSKTSLRYYLKVLWFIPYKEISS